MPTDYRVPILMYHAVAEQGPPETAPYRVTPAAFREQMQFLRERGYEAILLDDWAACIAAGRVPDGRRVAITFDDGYRSVAQNAWPVLAEVNLRATMFVVTGRVGSVADWDRVSGDPSVLMAWDELRTLQWHGNQIASHCALHRDLTQLPDEAIAADGLEARVALRRELGHEVTAIAYPWGMTDARVRRVLGESGYRSGVGVTGGLSTLHDDPMLLPRIEIFGDDDLDAFALKIDADNLEVPARSGWVGADVGATAAPQPTGEAADRVIPRDDIIAIGARLGTLIDEATAIKAVLDSMLAAPPPGREPRSSPLQRRLLALFNTPVAAPMSRILTPYEELTPGIHIGFAPEANVRLTVAPKHDDSASPAGCLNGLRLSFSGGPWFSVEANLTAAELADARNFRVTLCGIANRLVACRLLLGGRPRHSTTDVVLGHLRMNPDERRYSLSREFALTAGAEASDKVLILIWQTGPEPLELELDWIDIDFA